MPGYSSITIIYNPNSTGNGKTLAHDLKRNLAKESPKNDVTTVETTHAGHAEELAYDLARKNKRPLIISASGDGGYNELVNGIMKAHAAGFPAVAGLLPAGNANDHFRNVHTTDTVLAIIKKEEQSVDLLRLESTMNGQPYIRYAHSYIGVGLTPKVGKELNRTSLNIFKEVHIVFKVLFFLKPVQLIVNSSSQTYDSLVFSTVRRMSKVLTIARSAKHDDGEFEVTAFRRRNKLNLIASLLRATTTGLESGSKTTEYIFKTVQPTLVQLDGEIVTLDADSETTIHIEPQALTCIV